MQSDLEKFLQKYANVTEEYKFYNNEVTLRYDVKKHVYYLVTGDALVKQDGVTTICKIIDKSHVLIPWAVKMMEMKARKLMEPFTTGKGSDAHINVSENCFYGILQQAKTAHKDKLEEAGAIGHKTHAWIEDFIHASMSDDYAKINTILLNLPDDDKAKSAATAALDWIKKHNVRFICTERKIYSRKYSYAGTMDGLCLADSCDDKLCCPEEFKNRRTLIDWKTSNYLYVEYILQTAAYKQAHQEEMGEVIEDIWVIRLGKDDSKFEAWHVPSDVQDTGWEAFYSALTLSRAMKTVEEGVQGIKERKKVKKIKKTS